jgi:hypothetical protein
MALTGEWGTEESCGISEINSRRGSINFSPRSTRELIESIDKKRDLSVMLSGSAKNGA